MPRADGVILESATVVTWRGAEQRDVMFAGGAFVDSPPADAQRVDASGYCVFPGLVNAHDHLQLNCIPSLPGDVRFGDSYEWIDAFEQFMQQPAVAEAARRPADTRSWHGAYKNVLAGVTTVGHHDPRHAAHDHAGFPVGLPRDMGWCHSLGLGTPAGERSPRYGPSVRASFAKTDRTRPWVIHLAEGVNDVARRELAQLREYGCLAVTTVLVHGVGLSDEDTDRVVAAGASVVWCPSSNLRMFGQTLRPRRLLEARRIALGTDSRLTGSRDLLDELRVAAANSDLSPRELLWLVTDGARSVLRLPRNELRPGHVADLMMLRRVGDPYESLLAAERGDVCAVVREGRVQLADTDLSALFSQNQPQQAVQVDGREKVMAGAAMRTDAALLECGLMVS